MNDEPLPDRVLRSIAEGTGRAYPHEGRSMATEILMWRERAKDAAAAPKAPAAPVYGGGTYP